VLYQETSHSSFGLLLVVLVRSRLLTSSYSALTEQGREKLGMLADNKSTYFTKASFSSFSNSAILLLVYLLSLLLKS
jgi:hypothetical protein